MKILVQYWNAEGSGSVFDCFIETVKSLSQTHEVTVLLPRPGATSAALHGISLRFHPLCEPERASWYLPYSISLTRHLILLREFDVVYVFDYNFWKPSFLLAAKLLKIPVVNHVRYIFTHLADLTTPTGALTWSSTIICNSEATASRIRTRLPAAKVEVLYNFVPTKFIPPPRKVCGKRIGYVGPLVKEKGIDTLISAAALLDETPWEIKIFGPEKEVGVLAELQALVIQLGLSNRISFLGYVADRELIFNSLDILVLPSWEEAFGFVLIEAGAYSIPVVASNSGAIPEIVNNGISGYLVPARDDKALAEALQRLLNQPDLQLTLGEQGRKIVLERFSASSSVRRLESILSENRT